MPLKALSRTSEPLIHFQPKYSVQKYWAWQHRQVSRGFPPDHHSLQSPPAGYWFSTTRRKTWRAQGELAADRAIGAALPSLRQRAGQRTVESRVCGGRNLKRWLEPRLGSWLRGQRLDALGRQAQAAEAIRSCSSSAESSSTRGPPSQRAKATRRSPPQRSDRCRGSAALKPGARAWIIWEENMTSQKFCILNACKKKGFLQENCKKKFKIAQHRLRFFAEGRCFKKQADVFCTGFYLLNDFTLCAKSSTL